MANNPLQYHTCPNCGSDKQLKYCPECGQKQKIDFTMASILKEAGAAVWGMDSVFVRTLRDYINPGMYTRNWLDKKQAGYIAPIKMFLIINVIYFILLALFRQFGVHFDTFVTSFDFQLEHQFYSSFIRDSAIAIITSAGFELEEFAKLYDSRVFAVSNSLIIILNLLIALVLYVINFGKSRLLYHHLTMGLYYGGYILLFSLAANLFVLVLVVILKFMATFLGDFDLTFLNAILEVVVLLFFFTLAFFTQRRMYTEHKLISILKAVLIAILIMLMGIILYRFILFWITMASVLVFS